MFLIQRIRFFDWWWGREIRILGSWTTGYFWLQLFYIFYFFGWVRNKSLLIWAGVSLSLEGSFALFLECSLEHHVTLWFSLVQNRYLRVQDLSIHVSINPVSIYTSNKFKHKEGTLYTELSWVYGMLPLINSKFPDRDSIFLDSNAVILVLGGRFDLPLSKDPTFWWGTYSVSYSSFHQAF